MNKKFNPSKIHLKNLVYASVHRKTTFSIVLYGCEAWFLALRKECRLRVFENRILRRICGPEGRI